MFVTPKKVEIIFEDHYSLGDTWHEQEDGHDICILAVSGFLMKEDEKYYYVVNTYEPKTKNYQAGTAVLKNCVIKYTEYEDTPADKRKPNNIKPKRG